MDLIWRSAQVSVVGGPEGNIFVPVLYAGSSEGTDHQLRLGRGTDWRGGEDGPVRGVGQRMWLMGDDAKPILQVHEIVFDAPSESDSSGDPS